MRRLDDRRHHGRAGGRFDHACHVDRGPGPRAVNHGDNDRDAAGEHCRVYDSCADHDHEHNDDEYDHNNDDGDDDLSIGLTSGSAR